MNKISNFLFRWRPIYWRSIWVYELISFAFMFASVPMLGYGIRLYNSEIIITILLTIGTLYSGYFAVLIWNDITDKDIDIMVHPDRALPRGTINTKKFFIVAVIFSALTFTFAILINFWCLIVVGCTALFVTFHNKYLKKNIKIPAYSEIFTPIQWVVVPIFGSIAIQSFNYHTLILLVLFTYFADASHDIAEGIHDIEGDRKFNVKTYTTSFGERTASIVSFSMLFLSGIIGIIFYFNSILTIIFLIPFLTMWIYVLYITYKLVISKEKDMKDKGKYAGKKGFDFLLFTYAMIFTDIVIQLIVNPMG